MHVAFGSHSRNKVLTVGKRMQERPRLQTAAIVDQWCMEFRVQKCTIAVPGGTPTPRTLPLIMKVRTVFCNQQDSFCAEMDIQAGA